MKFCIRIVTTNTIYCRHEISNNVCGVNTHFIFQYQGSAGGGHYIAYCCNRSSGLWYEYNDSRVSEVSESHVLSLEVLPAINELLSNFCL